MNQKNKVMRLTALLLAVFMLLSACSSKEEPPAPSSRRTVAFEEMNYERPDVDNMIEQVHMMQSELDQAKTIEEQLSLYNKMETLMDDFGTMYSLARIHNSMDAKDTFYKEENDYLSQQEPLLSSAINDFQKKFVGSENRDQLRKEMGEYRFDAIEKSCQLISPQVESLQQQESALVNQYLDTMATATVTVRDQEVNFNQLETKFPDLSTEELIAAQMSYFEKYNKPLGEIYLQLNALRKQIAEKLGFDSVADMYYVMYNRDYTPQQSKELCKRIVKNMLPIYYKLPVGNSDAKVKMSIEEGYDKLETIFSKISPEIKESFQFMRNYHLIDMEPRDNKESGAFTMYINGYDAPFICGTWDGTMNGVTTTIHEFGHFNDFYSLYGTDNMPYASSFNLDIGEVYSQGLEMLMQPYYEEFVGSKADDERANAIDSAVSSLLFQALLEDFQQRIFEEDIDTVEELNELYYKIRWEYGLFPYATASGEDATWITVTHLAQMPFYTISYSTSLFSALELWGMSQENWQDGWDAYEKLVKANRLQTYDAWLKEAGLLSPFDEGSIDQLADLLWKYGVGEQKDTSVSKAA